VKIGGSIFGTAAAPILIGARGQATPTPGHDLAISSISIKGSAEYANIGAGWDFSTATATNADAQIGTVSIGLDWIASNVVAGAAPGLDGFFGTADDVLTPGGTATVASIAKIVIKGRALGTPGGADHFGIVAEQIISCKIGPVPIPLLTGPGNDLPPDDFSLSSTGDIRLREVAP
jgi:hypothetical protein